MNLKLKILSKIHLKSSGLESNTLISKQLKPLVQSPRRIVPFYGIAASIIFGILVIIFWPSKLSEKELVQLAQPPDYQSVKTLATEKNEVIQEV